MKEFSLFGSEIGQYERFWCRTRELCLVLKDQKISVFRLYTCTQDFQILFASRMYILMKL